MSGFFIEDMVFAYKEIWLNVIIFVAKKRRLLVVNFCHCKFSSTEYRGRGVPTQTAPYLCADLSL